MGGDGDDGVRGSDIEHALAELKSLALFRRGEHSGLSPYSRIGLLIAVRGFITAIALVGLDGVVDSNYLAENLSESNHASRRFPPLSPNAGARALSICPQTQAISCR